MGIANVWKKKKQKTIISLPLRRNVRDGLYYIVIAIKIIRYCRSNAVVIAKDQHRSTVN